MQAAMRPGPQQDDAVPGRDQASASPDGNCRYDQAIAHCMIEIARALGVGIVINGVDTPEQARAFQDVGCVAAQGRIDGAALLPRDVPAFLEAWSRREAERGLQGEEAAR